MTFKSKASAYAWTLYLSLSSTQLPTSSMSTQAESYNPRESSNTESTHDIIFPRAQKISSAEQGKFQRGPLALRKLIRKAEIQDAASLPIFPNLGNSRRTLTGVKDRCACMNHTQDSTHLVIDSCRGTVVTALQLISFLDRGLRLSGIMSVAGTFSDYLLQRPLGAVLCLTEHGDAMSLIIANT